jgi:putative membrane protein
MYNFITIRANQKGNSYSIITICLSTPVKKEVNMINRFLDHTANERTYLSWISTAIAIMAFGFVVERFDIFISYLSKMLGNNTELGHTHTADIAGIGLLFIGIFIIIMSTVRFILYKKAIASEKTLPYGSVKVIIFLAIVLTFLGGFLIFYLWHHIH